MLKLQMRTVPWRTFPLTHSPWCAPRWHRNQKANQKRDKSSDAPALLKELPHSSPQRCLNRYELAHEDVRTDAGE